MSATFIKGNQRRVVSQENMLTEGRDLLRNGWTIEEGSAVDATAVFDRRDGSEPSLESVRLSGPQLEQYLRTGGVEGTSALFSFSPRGGDAVQAQVNEEEWQRRVRDRGMAGTFGVNMLGGATLGLGTRALGFDGELEQRANQEFGEAQALGRVAGEVLPLLVGAPTSAASLGSIAGRAVAGRSGSRLAGLLAEGAIEGAASGFTDSMLANESNAEQIAERMLAGGALGLAIGGGFAAGGAALRAGGRSAAAGAGALGRRVARGATEGAEAGAGQAARPSLLDRLEMFATGSTQPSSRFSQRALVDHNQFQQAPGRFVRELSEPLEGMSSLMRRNLERLGDVDDAVARRLADTLPDGAQVNLRRAMAEAAADARAIPGTVDSARAGVFREAGSIIDRVAEVAADADDIAKVVRQAELAGSELRRLRRKMPASDPAFNRLEAVINGFDDALESSTASGAGFAERRELLREGEDLRKSLARSLGIDEDRAFDPGQLQRAIMQRVRGGDTAALEQFKRLNEFNVRAANFLGEPPGAAIEARRALGEMAERLGEVAEVEMGRAFVARGDAWRGVVNNLAIGAGYVAGGMLGLPFAAQGLLAGIAGIGALRISSPINSRARIAVFKEMMGRQATRATRAVNGIEANLADSSPMPKGFRTRAAKIRPALGSIAHTLLRERPEQRREMYDAMMDSIEQASADPASLARNVQRLAPTMSEINPGLPREFGMGLTQMLGVLMQEAARRNPRRSMTNMMQMEIPPSQYEVDDFLRTAAVVEDPIFGLELLEAGQMTPRAGRAMVRAFPQMMSQVVQQLSRTIATRRRNGQNVNYQAALQVSSALGAPLDHTMTPDFIAAMSNRSAQTSMQESVQFSRPVSTRRPASLVESTQTASQMLQ